MVLGGEILKRLLLPLSRHCLCAMPYRAARCAQCKFWRVSYTSQGAGCARRARLGPLGPGHRPQARCTGSFSRARHGGGRGGGALRRELCGARATLALRSRVARLGQASADHSAAQRGCLGSNHTCVPGARIVFEDVIDDMTVPDGSSAGGGTKQIAVIRRHAGMSPPPNWAQEAVSTAIRRPRRLWLWLAWHCAATPHAVHAS